MRAQVLGLASRYWIAFGRATTRRRLSRSCRHQSRASPCLEERVSPPRTSFTSQLLFIVCVLSSRACESADPKLDRCSAWPPPLGRTTEFHAFSFLEIVWPALSRRADI